MAAHGISVDSNGDLRWRVWAPRAERAELLLVEHKSGDFRSTRTVVMDADGEDFVAALPRIRSGQLYQYRLHGDLVRPDPAARFQPFGVHGPSAVYLPERYEWHETDWRGVVLADLVIYELHVGTFTAQGTFAAIVPRLPQLVELGVTAIELMPVAQFPGERNWGYDGVFAFAVQNSYGGPQALQRFVDECHAVGLAVILDVVYNHVGPEGNYLRDFGPYFTDHYKTPWGEAINFDEAGSDGVRRHVLENARMWLTDYRLDGLRLDAVHAIYDRSAKHILEEIREVADEVSQTQKRQIQIIAESDLNDIRLLKSPEQGGYGLDAQWSDDFHHAVHAFITGENQGYYQDFGAATHLAKALRDTFVYDGCYSQHRQRRHGAPVHALSAEHFVVFLQNHDQIGNRAVGERLSELVDSPTLRLAASLLLLSPYTPLIFMGEEYAEERPFPFFCYFADEELIHNVRKGRREEFAAFGWQSDIPDAQAEETFQKAVLGWNWHENSTKSGVRNLYKELLHARKTWPGLRERAICDVRLHDHGTKPLLQLSRGQNSGRLEIFFNLTAERVSLPAGNLPRSHQLVFSSEAKRFGGQRDRNLSFNEMLPHETLVFGE